MLSDKYDASRKFIVIVEVILIKIVTVVSLQESTFASGGKNKAVKKFPSKKNRVLWIIFAAR